MLFAMIELTPDIPSPHQSLCECASDFSRNDFSINSLHMNSIQNRIKYNDERMNKFKLQHAPSMTEQCRPLLTEFSELPTTARKRDAYPSAGISIEPINGHRHVERDVATRRRRTGSNERRERHAFVRAERLGARTRTRHGRRGIRRHGAFERPPDELGVRAGAGLEHR